MSKLRDAFNNMQIFCRCGDGSVEGKEELSAAITEADETIARLTKERDAAREALREQFAATNALVGKHQQEVAQEIARLTRERDAALARIKVMDEALDYYGCIDHYTRSSDHSTPVIMDDRGNRARAARHDQRSLLITSTKEPT